MRHGLIARALLGLGLAAASANAAEVESLRQAGPAANRFNIVVLGDGYRTQDQAKLKTDAQGIIDYVFGIAPLRQYAQFFNVKLLHVISNENGADNGSYGATRDTALGAYFNCDGIDRLLCIDDGKVAVAAAADVPEYNFAIVIVNDSKYGGSGGPVCAASANEDSFEALAHEIGHSLAHLADEYSDEGNQPPCSEQTDCLEANATLRTTREQIKWQDWIEATTPLPTPATQPYGAVTGLFEGARYTPTGIYRPQLNCKMRGLGADYCSVCTEQLVRSIWTADNIKMIESKTPASPAVQSVTCEPIVLSVKSPPITPSTYRYTWVVDGKVQPQTSSSLSLFPGNLLAGEHDVQIAVADGTALVRTDLDNVLQDRFSWTVTVTKSDCPPQMGGAGGSAGGGGGGGSSGSGGEASAGGGVAGAAGAAGAAGGIDGTAGTAMAGVAGMTSGGAPVIANPNPPPPQTSGCGCAVPGHSERAAWPLVLLGLGLGLGSARGSFSWRRAARTAGRPNTAPRRARAERR